MGSRVEAFNGGESGFFDGYSTVRSESRQKINTSVAHTYTRPSFSAVHSSSARVESASVSRSGRFTHPT